MISHEELKESLAALGHPHTHAEIDRMMQEVAYIINIYIYIKYMLYIYIYIIYIYILYRYELFVLEHCILYTYIYSILLMTSISKP